MTLVSFNGKPVLELPGGGIVVGECDETRRRLRLRMEKDGVPIWETDWIDLRPDPTGTHSTSQTADYVALVWEATQTLVVLGDPMAVLIDVATGKLRASFSAAFVGQSSLEIACLALVEGDRLLIVASTKRVWVIDDKLQPVVRYEPRFMLAGSPRLVDGRLVVPEYDFDSDQEIVEEIVDLET